MLQGRVHLGLGRAHKRKARERCNRAKEGEAGECSAKLGQMWRGGGNERG